MPLPRPNSALIAAGFAGIAAAAFLVGRLTAPDLRLPASRALAGTGSPANPSSARPGESAGAQLTAPNRSEVATAGVPESLQRLSVAITSIAGDEERLRLIKEWAGKDPAAAMAYVTRELKGDRRAQATAAVLQIWGKNNPEGAWNWVATNQPTATHHFDTLLEVFGQNDSATAARFAAAYAQQHPSATLEVYLSAMLGMAYRGDYAAARQWVEASPSLTAEVRGNLQNFIAGQWARYQPEQAAAWVMNLPAGPQRDQALIGLGESWSDADPARAAAFALGLPEGDSRKLALRQAIAKWVMTDAGQARAWVLQSNEHEDFDQAVAAITTDLHLVNRDPAQAIEWAKTIFDDGLRFQSFSVIVANLYPRDPAAAVNYIRSLPDLTDEQRTQLLNQFPPKD